MKTIFRLLLQILFRFRAYDMDALKTPGPVTFTSASGKLAVARAAGLLNIRLLRDNHDGTATYAIDLAH